MERLNTKPSDLYTTLRQTAIDTVKCHANQDLLHDPTLISKSLTQNCRRILAPSSFGKDEELTDIGFTNAEEMIQGIDNTQYEKELAAELPLVEDWNLEIIDVMVDEIKRAATVWGRYFVTVKGGEKFVLEFIQMLLVEVSSSKVERIVEFVDTAMISKWDAAMKNAAKRLRAE